MSRFYFNQKIFRYSRDLMLGSLLTISAVGLVISLPAKAAEDDECFAIADNDRGDNRDVLVRVFKDAEPEIVGSGYLGTTQVEATTFSCDGSKLYVVDGNVLGTVDLAIPKFIPIGSIGTGDGAEGIIEFKDIDGLAFDCKTGKLYGTERREHKNPPQNDLLIQIDPATGALVPNVFADGADYVAVTGVKQDVDALTWEPLSKAIYLTSNDGDGKNDVLAVLDTATGEATYISDIPETDDIEGLEFSSLATIPSPSDPSLPFAHELFGITGDDIAAEGGLHAHRLYPIKYPYPGEDGEVGVDAPTELSLDRPNVTDLEALACRSAVPDTCLLYAVDDPKVLDSQIIVIDPGKGTVTPLGPYRKRQDIEGLAIVPNGTARGKLYGSVGGDQTPPDKAPPYSGGIYEIDRDTGDLSPTPPPLTGFHEVSSLAINPIDSVVWGWSKGGTGKPKSIPSSATGPITINPVTAAASLVKAFTYAKPHIEAVAFSNDGKKLYATQSISGKGTYLYAYDVATQSLNEVCPVPIKGESEALEIQPNGLLLMAVQDRDDLMFIAYNPETCSVDAMRIFKDAVYKDIESIEWPADECGTRSFLSSSPLAGSVDLDQDMTPQEVEDAIDLALDNQVMTENANGVITVYTPDGKTYLVKPVPGASSKSGDREDEWCEVETASLDLENWQLIFTDCHGTQTWDMNSVPESPRALLKMLNTIGRGTIDEEDGFVSLELQDGTSIVGELSKEITFQEPAAGQTWGTMGSTDEQGELVADIVPLGDTNGDGMVDYQVNYPDGAQQELKILSVN